MRFDIYGLFVVRVIAPRGGPSKGRPIALIEDTDKWSIADLLIPNDLTDSELERYVADRYATFARPAREICRLHESRRAT
jgi:hypothetical protein